MNICIFGDSITWGGYDPQNGGWTNILRNYLEENYDEITAYNLGVCADDSSGLLKRLAVESAPRTPDLIILAIGANDVKHQPEQLVPFEKFKANIEALLSQASQIAKNVITIGITPVDEALTTPRNKPPYNYRENKDIDECNNILQQASTRYNFTFIPCPSNFSSADLADGLHPNTSGHLKIFETIKPIVENIISQH